MALGDFVHAKGSQHGAGEGNDRFSRQRAAELARVEVPPTKLNGFPNSPRKQAGRFRRAAGNNYGHNTSPDPHDMFDTDIEGIDDSTTVRSLSFDGGGTDHTQKAKVQQREELEPNGYMSRPSGPENSQPATDNTYKTVSERMQELDSDPGEAENRAAGIEEAHQMLYGTDEYHAWGDMNRENAQAGGWNSGYEVDRGQPLSWQRIEEALHENYNRRAQSTAAVASIGGPYQAQDQMGKQDPGPDFYDIGGFDHPSKPQTSEPVHKTPTKSRASVRSRFMTPNFQNEQNAAHFGTTKSYIPRPSSTPGVSFSPRTKQRQAVDDRAVSTAPHTPPPHDIEAYKPRNPDGLFDNTDLSALDDDGSTDPRDDASSTHLSTVSPPPPKRPLPPANPFISDYPPNILLSKNFSDLQSESFDYDPAPAQSIFPPQEHTIPLEEKLSRLTTLTDDQRRALFSGLSLAEWEESGDWLIEQFSVILRKTKEARRERRKVASVFEAEIKRRYDLAESEEKHVKERLDDMRSGGMGVLKKQNGS